MTASSLVLARNRRMTRVRIMRPIMLTPSSTPEARETTAVSTATVGTSRPLALERTPKLTVSRSRVWAMTATKNVSPRMNSMVSRWTKWLMPENVRAWCWTVCHTASPKEPPSAATAAFLRGLQNVQKVAVITSPAP
jgi:hypothetical protein